MPKLYITLATLAATFTSAIAFGPNVLGQGTNAPRTAAARPAATSAAPSSSGTIVAVIDTYYIMRKHEKMVNYLETFGKRINESKVELQGKEKLLQKEKEDLRDLKVGSDEYRAKMETIIQHEADHLASVKVRESQFAEEKAKMDYEIFKEIEATIKQYADRKGIDLVLSFSSEKPTFENQQSLVMAVRNSVQYQKNLDITLEILEIVSPNHKMAGKDKAPVKGGAPTKQR